MRGARYPHAETHRPSTLDWRRVRLARYPHFHRSPQSAAPACFVCVQPCVVDVLLRIAKTRIALCPAGELGADIIEKRAATCTGAFDGGAGQKDAAWCQHECERVAK